VLVGDVIYIEANSGAVKRVGRSDAFATEFDLEAEEYVPLPKGEVHKKKEIVQVVLLILVLKMHNPECVGQAELEFNENCDFIIITGKSLY